MVALVTLLAGAAMAVPALSAGVPDGCPLPDWNIDELHWFNGSSSLNCFGTDRSKSGCYTGNPDTNYWVQPISQDDCRNVKKGSWVPVCATGFQSYQPWGYGSPEYITLKGPKTNCRDTYKGYRNYEIGGGRIDLCSSHAESIVNLYASSSADSSTARIERYMSGSYSGTCTNGSRIAYHGSVEFTLDCSFDPERNATCTATNINIPVTDYTISN